MSYRIPVKLGGSGNVRFNTRFSNIGTMFMTGNVTLTLDGMAEGETVYVLTTQDSTGGRTLTINPISGTSNKVNANTGISTASSVSTLIDVTRLNGLYNITYTRLDGTGGSGGGGGTGTVNSVNGQNPDGAGAVTIAGTNINSTGINAAGSSISQTVALWLADLGNRVNTATSSASTATTNAATAQSTANSANSAAGTAQTTANTAVAALPYNNKTVGVTYNKSTWADLTDFSSNTLSATISGGKISIPNAGVSDFTKSLQLSPYSCVNNWKFQIEFQLTQSPAAGTTGISIGIQSQNANSLNSIAVYFRCVNDGNLGRMEFFAQSNSASWVTVAPAQANLSLAANNNIRLSIERQNQNVIMRAENLSNAAIAPVTFTYILPFAANPIPPNTGRYTIYAQGGTFTINKVTVVNNEVKSPSVLLLGDSKTMGYGASNFFTTYPGLLGRYVQNISVSAGFGDKTADVLNRMPELLAIAPKQVILSIGSNDARSGVANGTFQTNYASIVSQLTSAGAEVIHLSPSYETPLDLTVQNTYVNTNYAASLVDVFYTASESGNLYSDNIHWSDNMNRAAVDAIRTSGFLKGLQSNQNYFQVPITIDRDDITTAQTDAQLNATYSSYPVGTRIYAANISGGGILYEKRTYNAWRRFAILAGS